MNPIRWLLHTQQRLTLDWSSSYRSKSWMSVQFRATKLPVAEGRSFGCVTMRWTTLTGLTNWAAP